MGRFYKKKKLNLKSAKLIFLLILPIGDTINKFISIFLASMSSGFDF